MKILYHLPILPPEMPMAEALSQEIAALRRRFDGDLIYLNPNDASPIYIPRFLFGFHKLRQVREREKNLDLHHFYNPDPYPFPILRRFRRPVIYSLSSGLGEKRPPLAYLSSLAAVTVYDERSWKQLQAHGLDNVFLVKSGVDTGRFTHTPAPLQSTIKLLVASAPWTKAQFRTKGIEALLTAVRQMPHLQLVFLWRGVLIDEMRRRVQRLKLAARVQVINRQVDVNQILASVHGTINLATKTDIIKAYPHSLLDSLAAGKPVIVSRAIPMSDYVERVGCGKVVEEVTVENILMAVEDLRQNYRVWQETAVQVGQRDFSQEGMIDSFKKVYQATMTG
jgi:glycosyltransferase involved in cell wall biosynthesis